MGVGGEGMVIFGIKRFNLERKKKETFGGEEWVSLLFETLRWNVYVIWKVKSLFES